ncbi:acyltransferase domain-containing protein [Paenibacillus sp. HJL G12]|uniref:Acyltransferase domain-containing protein n=1 Tax=Paenibacillus dendrobii TaxID=2691084 RepID=A0A7X3LIS6_9BACL|nr:acyltransferase domain-containing protein [Paenibacillus dendrobii]MWV45530.1 acyltransferase domain-containing protein [Paenibacillus dendrobii]
MFGGQGSQYYQMGIELYRMHPVFRSWMNRLDSLVSEIAGFSVIAHLYDDRKSLVMDFDNLTHTHPAIFMIQYSLARTLMEEGIEPDVLLGLSLGEYVSAAVANVVEVEAMLETVLLQSELIQSACEKGGMIAILSNSDLYDTFPQLHMASSLVAVNYDGHFVIAGKEAGLSSVESWLSTNGILHQRLPVSYAFHSAYMEPIKTAYMHHLRSLTYQAPTVPWLPCASGDFCEAANANHLWQAIREPMRLGEALKILEQQQQDYMYVDLSPSGTLAAMVTKIQGRSDNSRILPIITKFNQDASHLRRVIDWGLNGLAR